MTHTIITPCELEAISLAASTEETRHYLNGVNIELYEARHALIATDGHRLAAIGIQPLEAVKSNFILGNDDIKKAVAMAKAETKNISKYSNNKIKIQIEADNLQLMVKIIIVDKEGDFVSEQGDFKTKAIDGTFPDFRRVIPAMPEAAEKTEHCFNGKYLSDFAKMAKILGDNLQRVAIRETGNNNPTLIELPICSQFTGVLMPMRF